MILHDYGRLPNKAQLDRYINEGCPLGGFLEAVVTNDLRGACDRADNCNIEVIPIYVAYLYNEAPSLCWGSKEKYLAWLETKRTDQPQRREP